MPELPSGTVAVSEWTRTSRTACSVGSSRCNSPSIEEARHGREVEEASRAQPRFPRNRGEGADGQLEGEEAEEEVAREIAPSGPLRRRRAGGDALACSLPDRERAAHRRLRLGGRGLLRGPESPRSGRRPWTWRHARRRAPEQLHPRALHCEAAHPGRSARRPPAVAFQDAPHRARLILTPPVCRSSRRGRGRPLRGMGAVVSAQRRLLEPLFSLPPRSDAIVPARDGSATSLCRENSSLG